MSGPLRLSLLILLAVSVGCANDGGGGRRRTDAGPPPTGTDAGSETPDADTTRPDVELPPRPDLGPPRPNDEDNDGLSDDAEATLGTDPTNPDTDGDGYEDGVEQLAGTNPTDARSLIPPTDFYVVLPYEDNPQLRDLDFTARLGKGDVLFMIDTTASMGLAINNVRTSLSTMIVPALSRSIVDLVMGVGDYRDFPVDPYGEAGDWTYRARQPMTAAVPSVQTALNALNAGGGGDVPEALLEGLHDASTGTCAAGGGFGSACFRNGSFPIIVAVTDAEAHNNGSASTAYAGVTAVDWATTVAGLRANSVKIVGVGVSLPFPLPIPVASRPNLERLARDTGSMSAMGALTVYDAPGGSVSRAVVDGVVDLVGAARQDVTSGLIDDTTDTVDATRFIKAVIPVRATRATRFDTTTFYGVAGGTTITFRVRFQNDFLPSQRFVQIFKAQIEVLDVMSQVQLDVRNVYIVVPGEGGSLLL